MSAEQKPLPKWLPFGSLLLAIISATASLMIDRDSALINLLCTASGVFVSVFVALELIDRYLAEQRKQQWAKIRSIVYSDILAHLCDIAAEAIIYFNIFNLRLEPDLLARIASGREKPNRGTLEALRALAQRLVWMPEEAFASQDESGSDLALKFYEAILRDLDAIQDVLTPLVVQSSSEQQIVDALLEYGSVRRKLDSAAIAHKLVAIQGVVPHIAQLLEQGAILYGKIYEAMD